MVVEARPSSALPGTFSPQAGRRGYAAPVSFIVIASCGTSPLPASGERARVRGNSAEGSHP